MPISDWVDLPILRLISRHTVGSIAALVSYLAVSRLVEWAVGAGAFREILEYVDKTVLVIIFLYFLLSVGYDLIRAIRRHGDGQ
jgi:hypothetical protein